MITQYLKEFFRPVRLLMIIRHFKQLRYYKKNNLKLGVYSTITNTKIGNHIRIGYNCNIKNSSLECHTYCNGNTNIRNAIIGKYTCIGSNVNICIAEHPTNLVSVHPAFYSNDKAFETFSDNNYFEEYEKIFIGNDVWIGSKSTIMNGVNIGDGAIIAYGAVVTKDVLPYSIVGGIPAKHLKFRFGEETINKLLEIKWWELNESFLRKHFKLFHNPDEFIKFYNLNQAHIESFRNI